VVDSDTPPTPSKQTFKPRLADLHFVLDVRSQIKANLEVVSECDDGAAAGSVFVRSCAAPAVISRVREKTTPNQAV
jgi:hypothetical protein